MTRDLAILLWSAGIDRPALCATPFVHAAAAAALDVRVEIHFAGPSVRLLVEGVARGLRPWPDQPTTLYDLMRQAANLDVKCLGCAMAVDTLIAPGEVMIAEYAGHAGASAFARRALDPQWVTLVY